MQERNNGCGATHDRENDRDSWWIPTWKYHKILKTCNVKMLQEGMDELRKRKFFNRVGAMSFHKSVVNGLGLYLKPSTLH